MGKQLSIYLDEQEAKRLAEVAQRECRRPVDQVRYLLRHAMGLSGAQEQQMVLPQEMQNDAGQVLADSSAVLS